MFLCQNRQSGHQWNTLTIDGVCLWNSVGAKHCSHNLVDVFVDGVACDMDKGVCDQFSEIFRTQGISRSILETNAALGSAMSRVFVFMDAEIVRIAWNEFDRVYQWRTRRGQLDQGMDDKFKRNREFALLNFWTSCPTNTAAETTRRQIHSDV